MFFCLLNLEKNNHFLLLWKTTAVFLHWNLSFSLAGRIHPAVGRLICHRAFVSRDSLVRRQAVVRSDRAPECSPGVGPATAPGTPFAVSHS